MSEWPHEPNPEARPQQANETLGEIAVGQVISRNFPEIPLSDVVLERFTELPNRRQALRAKDSENLTVYISHAIAKKLYRCPCCYGDIPIGGEHVIVSRIQMSRAYSHHHVDMDCTQQLILPRLTDIEVISPQQASATEVNKKARKYRNKRR